MQAEQQEAGGGWEEAGGRSRQIWGAASGHSCRGPGQGPLRSGASPEPGCEKVPGSLGLVGTLPKPRLGVLRQGRGPWSQRPEGPSTGGRQGQGRKLGPESLGTSAPARPRLGSLAPAQGRSAWASPDFPVPGQAGWVELSARPKGRAGRGIKPGPREASSQSTLQERGWPGPTSGGA